MDVFEHEMTRSTIFKDRNVMSPHYIPEHLPYREDEIVRMQKLLAPALSQKRPTNIFIYGKTGTGKTSCTKHTLDRLREVKEKYNASVDSVYINCRMNNSKYQVLLKVAEHAWPSESFMGHPANHLHERILKYAEKGMTLVIALDEIDKVKDLDDLMYTLTRSNDDLKHGHLALIGISNDATFKDRLDPRSKSTLCQEEMVFPPYNAEQLSAILTERCAEGFKENTVDPSSIAAASAFAAKESGDARYALRLMLKAGELADDANRSVVENDVLAARNAVEEDIVLELINTLPDHQIVVLYAIATLEGTGKNTRLAGDSNVLFSGEVYEGYEAVCKKWKMSPRSARWFREYVNELEMMGLIITHVSGKGIRGNTRLIRLAFPADKVKTAVEKRFA
jgi:cell division control protein 6